MLDQIQKVLDGISSQALSQSTRRLSENYRGKRARPLLTDEQIAYLATRMPATHAALCHVLQKVGMRSFRSLLDIGSGSGATLFAVNELFPTLETLYFVEKHPAFLKLGKTLTKELPLFARTQWIQADVEKALPPFSCDLVIASYSLGEIAEAKQLPLAAQLWEQTQEVLVFVEPGTPQGFERLRRVRALLLEKGAFLVAPCPQCGTCPMAQSNLDFVHSCALPSGRDALMRNFNSRDGVFKPIPRIKIAPEGIPIQNEGHKNVQSRGNWCHFYTRLSRSSVHRRAKRAQLNYEDEKFSYLIVSRKEQPLAAARILRHPRKGKGHVAFTLCTPEGIKEKIVTKKEGELYRLAKKKQWGDAF